MVFRCATAENATTQGATQIRSTARGSWLANARIPGAERSQLDQSMLAEAEEGISSQNDVVQELNA